MQKRNMKIYNLRLSVLLALCLLVFATTAALTTTTETPALGVNCSNKPDPNEWCNAKITGEAICGSDGSCSCASNYFSVSNKVCISEIDLIPIILLTSAVTTNSFDITWLQKDIVKDLHLSYTVKAKPAYGGTGLYEVDCTVQTGQRKAACTGLGSGYKYNVTVTTSYNTEYMGPGTIQESTRPGTPGSLNTSASSFNASNVFVMWTPSQGKVDFYNVKVTQSNTNDIVKNQPTSDNHPEIYISNLTPGTNYTVSITAYSYGKSSEERVGTFRTDTEVPGPPGQPELVNYTMSSIKIRWTVTDQPNGDIKGHRVCIKYRFYKDQPYTYLECNNIIDGGIQEYEKTGLFAGTYYQFDVYTINDIYNSSSSSTLQQRTRQSVPGKVSELNAIPNDTNINVNWQRPSRPNGDIIAYEVHWAGGLDQQNCTVYLKRWEDFTLGTIPCSHNISQPDNITENKEHMKYLIIKLMPYTEYVIEVRAYTSVGPGEVRNKTVYTSVSVPDSVTDVIADVLNATAVNVTWTIQGSNPGHVTYTVTTNNLVDTSNAQQSCTVQDYTSSRCVVPGLEEYWVYSFSVVASTDAGSSKPTLSGNITTKEAVPGEISSFSFELFNTTENCDATKVTIHWVEPELLKRNSLIQQYIFYVDGSPNFTYNVTDPKPYSTNNREFTRTFGDIEPEKWHTWKVRAVNNQSTAGRVTIFKITQGVCAPPDWQERDIALIEEIISTPSTVTIQLPSSFFQNSQQGNIKEKGLIVLPSQSQFFDETSSINYSELMAWAAARSFQFEKEYKVIILETVTDQFIIGKDTKCETAETVVNFCNGPLPEQFSFRNIKQALNAKTDKDSTTTVIVAVVLGIIVVVLATSTVCLTLKLRKIRKDKDLLNKNKKKPQREHHIYMNEAVAMTTNQAERDSKVATCSSTDTVENQYASLDENCRDDAKTVYSVLQIN